MNSSYKTSSGNVVPNNTVYGKSIKDFKYIYYANPLNTLDTLCVRTCPTSNLSTHIDCYATSKHNNMDPS